MIRNYFKLAFRNLMKHKTFSFINIFGLSIGLTCCMLISLYIYHEYSYDRYHEKGDRIYQLNNVFIEDGEERPHATVPAAMAELLKQDLPEIEETTRLLRLWEDDKTLLKYEQDGISKVFYETDGYVADASFFEIFSYNFIDGNPKTALEQPNTIVITEEIAEKFFGDESAIGKQIRVSSSTNGDHDYTITGVFRPHVQPSHINAHFFLSIRGGDLDEFINDSTNLLNNNMFFTYFLLKEGTNPEILEAKFPVFIEKNMGEELKARGSGRKLFLTNLKDIHLNSEIAENVTPPGSRKYIYILASIAILTLLIACINFMNLSTSRSSKRSVEVGVRKVLGAEKRTLIWQFLGESLIMALIAFVVAVVFVQLFLPVFGQLAGKEITLAFNQKAQLYLLFLVLAVFTGFLAGSYPAFFLSSFKPVKVLKGKFSNSFAAVSLRKGLVVVQFVISIVLIIASVVISNQMSFLRSTDLGFQKEQQLVIPL
ncbi:MAG TPA: ABC transporter permease, partial [Gillisia sp.]|nr:ABC transporter permease [Gillisia sp.]